MTGDEADGSDAKAPTAPLPRFARIPTVLSADELLDKAFRRSGKVGEMKGDAEEKSRSREGSRIRAVGDTLSASLQRYEKAFPSFENLPPFYRDLAALLLDVDRARKSLGALRWAREQTERVQKTELRRLKAASLSDLGRVRLSAHGRMASVVKQVRGDLEYLNEVRHALRKLPTIDPETPTVVVAGYPNVGKSSLVAAISTAEPEIAPYPFTTKGIVVGHFTHRRIAYQIVDTPGLLDRPLEERNDIERQAVLALRHLADVLVFLLDPSEHCGYPIERQLALLAEVKRELAVPVIEAETKADVKATGSGRVAVSAVEKKGLDALLRAIDEAVGGDTGLPPARKKRSLA
ncbi:MAG TPA: NOG1 family protein [Candidatus Thermoplasmatota archaeon]|nr:NOG1 family protein [Candidatus Thermoplasmatota archaeon]